MSEFPIFTIGILGSYNCEKQGREKDIENCKNMIKEQELCFDAICTKSIFFEKWEQ